MSLILLVTWQMIEVSAWRVFNPMNIFHFNLSPARKKGESKPNQHWKEDSMCFQTVWKVLKILHCKGVKLQVEVECHWFSKPFFNLTPVANIVYSSIFYLFSYVLKLHFLAYILLFRWCNSMAQEARTSSFLKISHVNFWTCQQRYGMLAACDRRRY